MDEKAKQRLKHIKDATAVNKQHVKTKTDIIGQRSPLREMLENKNIDYRKHM